MPRPQLDGFGSQRCRGPCGRWLDEGAFASDAGVPCTVCSRCRRPGMVSRVVVGGHDPANDAALRRIEAATAAVRPVR